MTIHNPLHPGIIIKEILLDESTGLTVTSAAEKLGIDRTTLSRLLNGKSGVSAEMAVRLSMFLDTSPETWLNLQRDYDLCLVNKKRPKIKVRLLKKAP